MSNPVDLHFAVSPSFAVTIEVRDSCVCLHAQRAARALARRYDKALRPAGLTSGQFSLLMSLNRPEPAPMASVAALLAMDRTTLTANLKPLERRGLLALEADPRDRRARRLRLTPEGRAALAAAMPYWRAEQEETARRLAHTDPAALSRDLAALA
ncbi:MAG: winged helix-turn-helix transcriptional regulator [Proteobacteria bacterium]|nr:winged helix-turn-helix transcriptional regulator [Pseudomonadota bacterium]